MVPPCIRAGRREGAAQPRIHAGERQGNRQRLGPIGTEVKKDDKRGVEWFEKAAEKGEARAQFNLGVCYYEGRGVTRDYAKAVEWYRRASEQGAEKAQRNLGFMLASGKGTGKDLVRSEPRSRKTISAASSGSRRRRKRVRRGRNSILASATTRAEGSRAITRRRSNGTAVHQSRAPRRRSATSDSCWRAAREPAKTWSDRNRGQERR